MQNQSLILVSFQNTHVSSSNIRFAPGGVRILWCPVPPSNSVRNSEAGPPLVTHVPPNPPVPLPCRPRYLEITQEMFEGIQQTYQHRTLVYLPACTLESSGGGFFKIPKCRPHPRPITSEPGVSSGQSVSERSPARPGTTEVQAVWPQAAIPE